MFGKAAGPRAVDVRWTASGLGLTDVDDGRVTPSFR